MARSVRIKVASILVAASCVVAAFAQPAGAVSRDAWTQTGGGSTHNETNLGETRITTKNVSKLRPVWTADHALLRETGGAAVYAGVAYYAYSAGSSIGVKAVRLSDGHRLWYTRVSSTVPGATASVDRAIALSTTHKIIYVGGDQQPAANVSAISLVSHKVLWTVHATEPPASWVDYSALEDFAVDSGQLYIESDSGYLDVFDDRSGKYLWGYHHRNRTAPLEATDGKLIFTNTGSGRLGVYDGRTGHRYWRNDFGVDTAVDLVTVGAGRIIVADNRTVYAYSVAGCHAATCPPIWAALIDRRHPGMIIGTIDVSAATAHSVVVAYNGEADATTQIPGAVIEDLDAATGQLRWTARSTDPYALAGALIERAGSVIYAFVKDRLVAFPVNCAAICKSIATIGFFSGSSEAAFTPVTIAEGHLLIIPDVTRNLLDYQVPS